MTAHTYGWADVDQMNRTHYGRGKPQELLDAEVELKRAQRNLDEASDWYFEAAYEDMEAKADFERAGAAYDRAWKHYQALAILYNTRSAAEFDPHENLEPKF